MQGRPRCTAHQREWLLAHNGACPNHPDRPIWVKRDGLCSSCAKKKWRKKYLVTDEAYPRSATRETHALIDYIIREVVPLRGQLARYLRTRTTEPTSMVYVAYKFLAQGSEVLSDSHWRYLLARINDGAGPQDRIPDYRSAAP